MKKLLIVFGNEPGEFMKKLITSFLMLDSSFSAFTTSITKKEPGEALQQVLAHIRMKFLGEEDLFVVYAGDNLHLLKNNLPFDGLDLSAFFELSKQAVGGYDTPQQKEIINKIIIGSLKEFQR